MTKDQMKAAIDELNEAHGLNVEYSDDADGKELKAKLAEAKELSENTPPEGDDAPDAKAEGDVPESAEPSAKEEDAPDAPADAAPEAPVEEEEVPDVSPTLETHPHLYKDGELVARKASWPKGWWPSGDKVADTKVILDAAPKVSFLVPRTEGEDPNSEETVQINGYMYTIKKGNMVEIPKPVADLLARKYLVALEVAQRATAHETKEKSDALS